MCVCSVSRARPSGASPSGTRKCSRVLRVPDVLMYADTFRSPELRHAVPIGVPDPFLYLERDGARHIAIGAMETARLEALGLYTVHPHEECGRDELIQAGLETRQLRAELALRAVRLVGVTVASVPESFPVWLADH